MQTLPGKWGGGPEDKCVYCILYGSKCLVRQNALLINTKPCVMFLIFFMSYVQNLSSTLSFRLLSLHFIMHLLQNSHATMDIITLCDHFRTALAPMLSGDALRSDLREGLAITDTDRDNKVSIG